MFRFFDSTANLDIDQEANGMTTTVSVSGILHGLERDLGIFRRVYYI